MKFRFCLVLVCSVSSACLVMPYLRAASEECNANTNDVDCDYLNSTICPSCNADNSQPGCTEKARIYTGEAIFTVTTTANGEGDYRPWWDLPYTGTCYEEYQCEQDQHREFACLDAGGGFIDCVNPDATRNCWFCVEGATPIDTENYDMPSLTLDDCASGSQ